MITRLKVTESGWKVWGVSISQSDNTDMNPYYPVGFRGFYTMKYEISQVQYRDFLNTLTRAQQQERVASQYFRYQRRQPFCFIQ
jgi:formylglycine-generating enzyme required for sulfatase activity